MKIFPSAEQARQGSRNNVIIHREIRQIEEAILDAIASGDMQVRVSTSFMTLSGSDEEPGSGREYYYAWMLPDQSQADRSLIDQMNNVLIYFKDLGYSIIRKPMGASAVTFQWEIMW